MALKPNNDQFKPTDHLGKVMAARRVTIERDVTTSFGVKDVAQCGELAYEGKDGALHILSGVPIFNLALVRILGEASGDEWLIGRIGQAKAMPGQNPAVILVEMSDDETAKVEQALLALDATQSAPF
jgi:hypothetical protein